MADDFTLEQKQAIAIAEAKLKLSKTKGSAEWSDVVEQAPIKGAAGIADEILNLPQNVYNIGKTAAELGNAAFGPGNVNVYGGEIAPDTGEMTTPPDRTKDYLTDQGAIDPSLRGRMTPEQKMVDTGLQAATGSLAGGTAKQALVGGVSALAGQGVTEATGSETAGFLTSLLAPLGGSKISALNKARDEAIRRNATRDETLQGARDLRMVVVPEGEIANFAGRPEMIKTALRINQHRTNEVAIDALGLTGAVKSLSGRVLNRVRSDAYQNGYVPLVGTGRFITGTDYLNDLIKVEDKFKNTSFGQGVPSKIEKLVKEVTVADFDAKDAIQQIRKLRDASSLNLKSSKPERVDLGHAQRDIAAAIEDELERAAISAGAPPELLANYRAARKQIAISHTIENAMKGATGDVDLFKLGKMYDNREYMEGDLLKAAKFGSLGKPKAEAPNESVPFQHFAGAALAGSAAYSLGLPPGIGTAAIAIGGGLAARSAKENLLSKPLRRAMMSETGQNMTNPPSYDSLGIDPKAGALGGLMFEGANGAY